MRASTCDTVSRLCVRPECCWFAFPLVPALGSTGSAADRSALFASFAATTAGSDFPCSFIIGYRFSLPDADQKRDCPGRTRDLPSSDAILLRVICSSTPAGRAWPRLAALSMLRSTLCTGLRSCDVPITGLNHTPHATAVYASWPASPSTKRTRSEEHTSELQ